MATEKNFFELYFEWWLEELKSVGLVISYEREVKTYEIVRPLPVYYRQYFTKKEPIFRDFNLIDPITFTPDYEVVFSEKLVNKLFGVVMPDNTLLEPEALEKGNVYQETLFYTTESQRCFENYNLVFDVKPPANAVRFSASLGSSREFGSKRALLFQTNNIIVNKVVPIKQATSLFNKTFMPKRYRYTDSGSQLRKIQGNFRTMEQWLKEKEIEL